MKLKKILIGLLAAIVVLAFSPAKSVRAASADQYCTPGEAWVAVAGHTSIYQTFTPTQNRLTRIGLWMEGDGDGTIYLRLFHNTNVIGSGSRSEPDGYALIYLDFDNLELTPNDSNYRISLTTGAANANLAWHRSSDDSCSGGGHAYIDGEQKSYDFGFATYGYTQEEDGDGQQPQDEPQAGDEQTQQPGIDTTTNYGAAPSANVSTAIKPPTDVKAVENSTDEIAVKISWTESVTEEIDGYKVFRKTGEEDFGRVAQGEKTNTEFIDEKATEGTDYTYMVRSFKSNAESENSNEAFITASKKKASKVLTPASSEFKIDWTDPMLLCFFGSAAIAVLVFLLWFLIHRRKLKEGGSQQQ